LKEKMDRAILSLWANDKRANIAMMRIPEGDNKGCFKKIN
jgi:hypothetical protein